MKERLIGREKKKRGWRELEEMHRDGKKTDRYGQSWKRCIEMERRWIGMGKEEKEGGQSWERCAEMVDRKRANEIDIRVTKQF